MSLILQDRCWVGLIKSVRMVKFKFLAQLPVDHLAHPVVSTLIHLCLFGVLLLFTPLEFFSSVLADGFSLEFE